MGLGQRGGVCGRADARLSGPPPAERAPARSVTSVLQARISALEFKTLLADRVSTRQFEPEPVPKACRSVQPGQGRATNTERNS